MFSLLNKWCRHRTDVTIGRNDTDDSVRVNVWELSHSNIRIRCPMDFQCTMHSKFATEKNVGVYIRLVGVFVDRVILKTCAYSCSCTTKSTAIQSHWMVSGWCNRRGIKLLAKVLEYCRNSALDNIQFRVIETAPLFSEAVLIFIRKEQWF